MNNFKKTALSALLMILLILTIAGFVKNSSTDTITENTQLFTGNSSADNIYKGSSEYYYKSWHDGKIWHVMNLYSAPNSSEPEVYNNSFYSFSKDTVTVINKIILTDKNDTKTDLAFIP